jgi:CO dehydrogenase maturation factor
VNNLIRDHLDRLGRGYRHLLVDCEAGLEHISRRTSGRPDLLVCVCNRSRMAAETVRRALSLFRSLHGELPPRVDLMLNGFSPEEAAASDELAERAGGALFTRRVQVPHDPELAALERGGRALFELSPQSPARRALQDWRP